MLRLHGNKLTKKRRRELLKDIRAANGCEKIVTEYADWLLTEEHNNPDGLDNWVKPKEHPSTYNVDDVNDLDDDYENCLNSFGNHKKCNSYCLRLKNGKLICRFGFHDKLLSKDTYLDKEAFPTKDKKVKYKSKIKSTKRHRQFRRHSRSRKGGSNVEHDKRHVQMHQRYSL